MNVLAEGTARKSPQKIAAALRQTGLLEGDARYYHEGMEFSDSMTAMQIVGWIEEYYDDNVDLLVNMFEDYHVTLSRPGHSYRTVGSFID